MVSEIDHLLTWEGALAEAMAWSPGLPPWRREDHHRKRLKLCTHRRGSLGFRQLNVFGNRKASTLISTGNDREATLGELARLILALERSSPVRVAIDGRTASGKTTFADELGVVVAQRNREVIRTSIDGFHRPRAERYARGRYSPEGYYFDARDLGAIRGLLLDPLGPGGGRQYRTASFDLERDATIEQAPLTASANSVLVVDGTFLQRPELVDGWDVTVFLDTSEAVSERRGVRRDADRLGGADLASQLYTERYRPAFALYERLCQPRLIADAVVDNNDFEHPLIFVRSGGRLRPNPRRSD